MIANSWGLVFLGAIFGALIYFHTGYMVIALLVQAIFSLMAIISLIIFFKSMEDSNELH